MVAKRVVLTAWIAVAVAGCGNSAGSASPTGSTPTPTATPIPIPIPSSMLEPGPIASWPVVTHPPLPSPAPATCTESVEQGNTNRISLPAMSIPKGAAACQDVFRQTDLLYRFDLLNEGSLVAFVVGGADAIYLGDLATGSLISVPHDSHGDQPRVVSPQLVGHHLYWVAAEGWPDVSWRLMDMDVTTLDTTTIAAYATDVPAAMVTDGNHFAWVEPVSAGGDFRLARIKTRTLTDPTLTGIDLGEGNDAELVRLAIVDDGLLYVTVYVTDIMKPITGPETLWYWRWGESPAIVDAPVWDVVSRGGRILLKTGEMGQHVLTGTSPFDIGAELDRAAGTDVGVESMAADSDVVAWVESWWEADAIAPVDQLDRNVRSVSVWLPGWNSPRKLDTGRNKPWLVSAGGGWLVWVENNYMGDVTRIRGLPLATVATLSLRANH